MELTSQNTKSPLKNAKHEKFAQLVANGKSETDAYSSIYNTKSRNVARVNASKLLTNASVRARVRELQEENAKINAMSRAEKRNILAMLARDTKLTPKDRISAIQEDNKMTGDSEEKVNVAGVFTLKW